MTISQIGAVTKGDTFDIAHSISRNIMEYTPFCMLRYFIYRRKETRKFDVVLRRCIIGYFDVSHVDSEFIIMMGQ